jgi:hypothetical protein
MKFLKALILATGIAMLAVPLAQAKPSCSDPGLLGQAGYKAVCLPDVFDEEATPLWASEVLNEFPGYPPVPIRTEHIGGQYDRQVVPPQSSARFITEHQGGQYDPQPVRVVLITEHQGGQYDPQGVLDAVQMSTPFITEHQGGQYDPQPVPTIVNVTSDSGFSWEDAGIGAAGGMLLLLLAGGAVIAINRNRTRLASF